MSYLEAALLKIITVLPDFNGNLLRIEAGTERFQGVTEAFETATDAFDAALDTFAVPSMLLTAASKVFKADKDKQQN